MYICVYIYIYACQVLQYNLQGFTEAIVKRRALFIL